jgi:putative Holliday junction resolvase
MPSVPSAVGPAEPQGTVIAFDFGDRYVGVAVGETATASAHPLATIDAASNDERFEAIAKLVDEWKPAVAVVGLPLNEDGTPHEATARAKRFAQRVGGRFRLPVVLVDERFTSVEAAARLADAGRKGRAAKHELHPVAAQLILRSYFDDPTSRR